MKLTRESLKQIIKEELEEMMGGDQQLLGSALGALRSAWMTTKDLGKAFQSLTDAQAQRVSDFLVGEAENMNSGSPRPNNFFVNTPDIWQAYKAMRGMKENLKRKK